MACGDSTVRNASEAIAQVASRMLGRPDFLLASHAKMQFSMAKHKSGPYRHRPITIGIANAEGTGAHPAASSGHLEALANG